jgi:hypothetical protein
VQKRSTSYYDSLSSQVHQLYLCLGISVLISVGVLLTSSVAPRAFDALVVHRRRIAAAAAWIVGIALVAAWIFRPLGPKGRLAKALSDVAVLQHQFGLPLQANRSYTEQTMLWLEWYIGPVILALGIAGICILVTRAISSGSAVPAILLAELGGVTSLYLLNPHVTPEQIWAARRFATAAFPLFLLCAAVSLEEAGALVEKHARRSAWPGRIVAIGAAALVVFPLSTTLPVANFTTQTEGLEMVEHVCGGVGSDGAILFASVDAEAWLAQALRTWCGVPVAALTQQITPQQLQGVAAAFRRDGWTLWLADSTPVAIEKIDPRLQPSLLAEGSDNRTLARSLEGPPQWYVPSTLSFYAARVA